jgi:hypothetical protein
MPLFPYGREHVRKHGTIGISPILNGLWLQQLQSLA